MAVETLQDLIDLIETGPADVRQAAELVKRAVPQYPSATDLANADKFTLYKAGGTTEAIDGATLYSEVQAAHTVNSVATLRASSFPANLDRLYLSGYYGVGTPGGGELFRSSGTADGGIKFEDADGDIWERSQTVPGYVDVTWYGARDADYDVTDAFRSASQYLGSNGGGVLDAQKLSGTHQFTSNPFASTKAAITLLANDVTFEWDISAFQIGVQSHYKIVGQNVTFQADADNYTISPKQGLFETPIYQTTGSISSGSGTLTLTDNSDFEVGSFVAIQGANGGDTGQESTLAANISDTDTTIPINEDISNYPGSGTLWINGELIEYTTLNQTSDQFEDCVRGVAGTTAASHTSGDTVQLSFWFRSYIKRFSGGDAILQDSPSVSVTDAKVWTGAIGVSFDGDITIDARSQIDGIATHWYGVSATLASGLYVGPNVRFRKCNHGGVFLESAYQCDIYGRYEGCGNLSAQLGSDVWVFRGSRDNNVQTVEHKGGYAGVFIDDRTTGANRLDGQPAGNTVRLPQITDMGHAAIISGSVDNTVHIDQGDVRGNGESCLLIEESQGTTPRNCRRNTVYAGQLSSDTDAVNIASGSDNTVFVGRANGSLSGRGVNGNSIIYGPFVPREFFKEDTINPASIAAGEREIIDIPLSGAQVGDNVSVSADRSPSSWKGVFIDSWVVSSGTVRLEITNTTSSSVDPVSISAFIAVTSA